MALTVTGAQSFRVATNIGVKNAPTLSYPEAASQTFKKGAPIIFTSGGTTVEEGGADPTSIIGIADHDGNNSTASADLTYTTPLTEITFDGILGNGDTTDYTLLAADVGDKYGITKAAGGGWFVDKQKTAVLSCRVVVLSLKDPAGTVNGRVRFKFLDFVFDTDAAVASQIVVVNGLRVYAATA